MEKVAMISNPPDSASGIGIYTNDLVSYFENTEIKHIFIETDTINPAHIFLAAVKAGRAETDVVHIQHDYITFGPLSLYTFIFFPIIYISKIMTGKSIVITMHEPLNTSLVAPPLRPIKRLYILGVNLLISFVADHMVFLTEQGLSRFRESVPITTASVIPHGVNVERTTSISSKEAKAKFGYEPDDIVISEPGYLDPRKGNHVLAKIAECLPEYEFLLAGGSPRKRHDPYEQKIRESSPANLQVTGRLDDEAFQMVFRASDLVVLPYLEMAQTGIIQLVNQSGVFNWCVAYGLPVAASDFLYFRQLQQDWGCVELFDPLDINEAANVVQSLITDTEKRDQLTESMNTLRESHSLRRIAQKYETIYQSC